MLRDIGSRIDPGVVVGFAACANLVRHVAVLACLHDPGWMIAAEAPVGEIHTFGGKCAVLPLRKGALFVEHVILFHRRMRLIKTIKNDLSIWFNTEGRIAHIVTRAAQRTIGVKW